MIHTIYNYTVLIAKAVNKMHTTYLYITNRLKGQKDEPMKLLQSELFLAQIFQVFPNF